MKFRIDILGLSKSGNSYFVKVSESIKTPFGDMDTELGIGYITKQEGAPEMTKGDSVNWTGNIQFAPIVDINSGVTTMVGNQYLHRVNLVSAELPYVAPVVAKIIEASRPVVKEEVVENAGGVPDETADPLD